MRTNSELGVCPNCETTVRRSQVLITYEKGDRSAMFAECPNCEDVLYFD